jgi:hypothetical protein
VDTGLEIMVLKFNSNRFHYTLLKLVFFRIRESTWQTLLILQNGLLSKIMWTILSQDSISPVLYDKYYPALDRRLQNILNEVKKCIATKSLQNVIVTDR